MSSLERWNVSEAPTVQSHWDRILSFSLLCGRTSSCLCNDMLTQGVMNRGFMKLNMELSPRCYQRPSFPHMLPKVQWLVPVLGALSQCWGVVGQGHSRTNCTDAWQSEWTSQPAGEQVNNNLPPTLKQDISKVVISGEIEGRCWFVSLVWVPHSCTTRNKCLAMDGVKKHNL